MKKNLRMVISIFMAVMMLQGVVFAGPFKRADKPTCPQKTMQKQDKDYKDKDIVEAVVDNKRLQTLAAAVQAAGLVDTLKGEGPFTVFAPVNKAFDKLPQGTVENLLKPENKEQLTGVLTYHVVPGKVMAEDVVKLDGKEVLTVNGQPVKVKVKDGEVFINDAKVITTDIVTKNGVIHLIDTVLLPK